MTKVFWLLCLLLQSGAGLAQNENTGWKAVRSGRVSIELIEHRRQNVILDVLLQDKGSGPDIKYSDVEVKAFDENGKEIRVERFPFHHKTLIIDGTDTPPEALVEKDGYTLISKRSWGDYSGYYNVFAAKRKIAKITVQWGGDKVEFTQF